MSKANLNDWKRAGKMRSEGYTLQAIADVEGKGLATIQRWLIKLEEVDGPLTMADGSPLKPVPANITKLRGHALREAYTVLIDLMQYAGDPIRLKAAQTVVASHPKEEESTDELQDGPQDQPATEEEIKELLNSLPQDWLTKALIN